MKLLTKLGQTTHKFSFQTAEQKQCIVRFYVVTAFVCSEVSAENNAMSFAVMPHHWIKQVNANKKEWTIR